jgi:hypothetical protein
LKTNAAPETIKSRETDKTEKGADPPDCHVVGSVPGDTGISGNAGPVVCKVCANGPGGVGAPGLGADSGDEVGEDVTVSDDDHLATRGQVLLATESAENGGKTVLEFDQGVRNRQSSQVHILTTRGQKRLATRGQQKLTQKARRATVSGHFVEAVKASKGTWAFRIRWREIDGKRPVVYVSRVSDVVYELIKGGDYEAFKRQLIAGHSASAIRASHTA